MKKTAYNIDEARNLKGFSKTSDIFSFQNLALLLFTPFLATKETKKIPATQVHHPNGRNYHLQPIISPYYLTTFILPRDVATTYTP